jgi:hypothetical protein
VLAVAQRLDRRFDDMRRGKKIGLADSQIDDALALGLERLGAGQDLECGFGAEPGHGLGEL